MVYNPLDNLASDPRDARSHPKCQTAASIQTFVFTNPILADPDGRVITGHGRLRATRRMNRTEMTVIKLAGLMDAQKRALRLADSNIAMNARGTYPQTRTDGSLDAYYSIGR